MFNDLKHILFQALIDYLIREKRENEQQQQQQHHSSTIIMMSCLFGNFSALIFELQFQDHHIKKMHQMESRRARKRREDRGLLFLVNVRV